MYLYHNFTEQNEMYFNNKIVERPRLKVRIWVNEAFMNYEITIINLTVDDSGVYTCVYKELLDRSVDSNIYRDFVRGVCFVLLFVKNSPILLSNSQCFSVV